jgi:hypothetical protein
VTTLAEFCRDLCCFEPLERVLKLLFSTLPKQCVVGQSLQVGLPPFYFSAKAIEVVRRTDTGSVGGPPSQGSHRRDAHSALLGRFGILLWLVYRGIPRLEIRKRTYGILPDIGCRI